MTSSRIVPWIALCAAALVPALASRPAQACGGLFCDAGPQSMPVDQSGENILFVWKGDTIEVHIQIQYEGDAEKFGWVIPLQSVPEFSVGSEPLFQALLNGSVPSYGYTSTADQCDGQQGGGNGNSVTFGGFGDEGGDDGGGSADGGEEPPGPEIIEVVTAGAFEITVIQGDNAQEVMDWLATNGYLEDQEAVPILQQYIDEGHLFGAVKLTGGTDVAEIHPIVLEFQGNEPCVPLRLTRIAAVENMAVRSFFLGDARMVPRNYRHVLVNPLKIDWLALGANYNEVITLAVDETNADGRAFVTEYAGPSSIVATGGLVNPAWDATEFGTVDPTALGALLQAQSLIACDDFGACAFSHPLMEGLLGQYITPPAGVPAFDYYMNQASYPNVDLSMWNGPEFAMRMDEFIIAPGIHGAELIQQNPYLTRMFTTISPAEMTEDPMFQENAMQPEIENLQMGVLRTLCNTDQVFTLPDGREIYLPEPTWPQLPDEPGGVDGAMPSSQIIEAVPPNGAPMRLTDNTEKIEIVLRAWNAEHGWGEDASGAGCSCATRAGDSTWLALFGLGALAARRRRGRS